MKHRSMTVLRAGMFLISAALFGVLVWLLWQTVPWAVSYTHLDVYKRQRRNNAKKFGRLPKRSSASMAPARGRRGRSGRPTMPRSCWTAPEGRSPS